MPSVSFTSMPPGSYFMYDKEWKMQLDSNLQFVKDFVTTTFTTTATGFGDGHPYEPIYLDRQDLDCQDKGMNGFALNNKGENQNGWFINYDVRCGGIDSKYLDKTLISKATQGSDQYNVTALKFHDVDCGPSGVITQYKLGRPDNQTINYNYKCAPVLKGKLECEDRSTGWAGFKDYVSDLSFIKPPVKCKDNESLSRFKLIQAPQNPPYTWDDWYKYDYTCCSTSVQNSITVVSDSTPPELPFHLENEDNIPLVFFVVDESNKSNPEVIRLFQILLKDQPWGYCADGYHHTDEGDCVLESPQLYAGFGCPEGSTDPDFLPEKQCVLPDFVDYPLGVKSYGADCAAPNTEFNYLTHYPNPPGAIATYNFCKTGTRTAQCAVPGYTVSQQGGFDHCMSGPLLVTPLPIGLVAIAKGTKVRDESFGGVWPMQAITSATLAFDGRLIVFSPTTGYHTIVPYKPEGGSLNLFATFTPAGLVNTGVWRFQTVQGTNKGLSLWNQEVFPKYPMTPQDYIDNFKDDTTTKVFNCAPGDAGGPPGNCGTCVRTEVINDSAPLGGDFKTCSTNRQLGEEKHTETHGDPNYAWTKWYYTRWCDRELTPETKEWQQKCASFDPSVLDINGKLDFCKCNFDISPITIANKQFDDVNSPNTRNLVYAPWSADTKTAPIYKTFCGQHDTTNNAPLFTSDVRCQAWCDANNDECALVKDDYCTKFPNAALCAQECINPDLDCYNTFDQMCTGANLDTEQCQTWCGTADCDDRLKAYCANLSGEALGKSNICGCFRSDNFYDTFFKSLESKISLPPSINSPSCYFPRCSNSNLKPHKRTEPCPPVQDCITSVEFDNKTGTITGNVEVIQDNDCHFCKPGAVWSDTLGKCVSYQYEPDGDWAVCADNPHEECITWQCKDEAHQVSDKCLDNPPASRRPYVTYDWKDNPWGPCTLKNVQTRTLICEGSDGSQNGDEFCRGKPRLPETQECVFEGNFDWNLSKWSECNDEGESTRTVKCIETTLGMNAPDRCEGDEPDRSKKCTYGWAPGPYPTGRDEKIIRPFHEDINENAISACIYQGKDGALAHKRDVPCKDQNEKESDVKFCTEDKPNEFQNCSWDWMAYETGCTLGNMEESKWMCVDQNKKPMSTVHLDKGLELCTKPKPPSEKCTNHWETGDWICEGTSGAKRTLKCVDNHGKEHKDNDVLTCVNDRDEVPPPTKDSSDCTTVYKWDIGGWEKCDLLSSTQKRKVRCLDQDHILASDNHCPQDQPHAKTQPCTPDVAYAWIEGEFGECLDDKQTREVDCYNSLNVKVKNSFCVEAQPPAEKPCVSAPQWIPQDFGECSKEGLRVRAVPCVASGGKIVEDEKCGLPQPEKSEKCVPVVPSANYTKYILWGVVALIIVIIIFLIFKYFKNERRK